MNILFLTHDFDAGGAARSMRMLIPRLHAFGHQITIATMPQPRTQMDPWRTYNKLGIKILHVPFPWVGLEYIGANVPNRKFPPRTRELHFNSLQILRSMTTDVACFNGYPSTSFAPHIRATQKVLIAREVLRTDTPLFDRYAKMLRRTIHKAVAIGPVELAQLRMIGINAEMVFNSAKNPPAFSPIKTAPPLHFGCFGKLYPDKGQDLLVIACAAIKDHLRKYNAHMHIYGNGDKLFLASINSIVQKKRLQDLVSFHGWVEDVESQISNMHCIVRPDRTGSPWGRDVIEAMSIGRPVLASGSEEIFIQDDHTGWLFRPDDPAHLAQKILNLCTIPQCLAVAGKTAFDFACINFDPETNARRIERIFLET